MTHDTVKKLLAHSFSIGMTLVLVLSMVGAGVSFAEPTQAQLESGDSLGNQEAITTDSTNINFQVSSENLSYTDDFSDGNFDGWTSEEGTAQISTESFWGEHSLLAGDPDKVDWADGRTFDTQESFELSGTYKADSPSVDSDGQTVRFGLLSENEPNDNPNEVEEWAVANVVPSEDRIYLESETQSKEYIDSAHVGEWMQFRMQFDSGTMRLKVWKAGTSEPNDWQIEHQTELQFSSKFYLGPGVGDHGQSINLDRIDAGAQSISGQVVDQNGNPVENTTVEALGVDYDSLNDSISNKQEEAERLLQEAEDPYPDSWNSDLQLVGQGSHFTDAETRYVAVHTTDDWQLGGSQLPGTEYKVDVNPTLGEPTLIAPNDDKLILTIWDPTDTGGLVFNREDSADADLPGRTTSGTMVIEQISPTGEVVDRQERETQKYVTLNPSFSFDTKTHEGVAVDLPNNHFYRVYPKGDVESAYTFSRGNPRQIGYAITQDLRTEAGKLTKRAQTLRSNIEGGKFQRVTTTTNATGHFEIRTLKGVQTASVQAYRADGQLLQDITGPSISDLRTAHERGYNGSVYISATPIRVDVPSQDTTITVYKSPTPPFGKMESYENILDYLESELKDSSSAILESLFSDELETLDLEELERRHAELQKLVENNEELQGRLEELLGSDLSGGDKSREELMNELESMDRAISDLEQRLEAGQPTTEIDGGTVRGTFPFADDLNADAVSVILHYQNGTSQVVPNEYWTVESTSVLGGDQVVVEGYPIPEDAAVADLEVTGISEDGRLGSSRGSMVNPAFDQDIPEIDAIDISTLRPGAGEKVEMNIRTDDPSFGGIEGVTVYSPDGSQLQTTTANGKTTFTPGSAVVHSVRVTYSNQGGTNFVQTFRINAKDQPTSDPPTVRIIKGLGGPTAIAGDQLESASVSVEGDTAEIIAQAPGGEQPSNIDVRAEVLQTDSIHLHVVTGSDEVSVNNHVSVRLHTEFGTEETLVYRGSAWRPITDTASTKYGAWETRENEDGDTHRVIETFTDSSGEVRVDTSRNPGLLEQVQYRIATISPVELPFAASVPTDELMTTALTSPTPVVAAADGGTLASLESAGVAA